MHLAQATALIKHIYLYTYLFSFAQLDYLISISKFSYGLS